MKPQNLKQYVCVWWYLTFLSQQDVVFNGSRFLRKTEMGSLSWSSHQEPPRNRCNKKNSKHFNGTMFHYCIYPKYLHRHAWGNSVDPDQMLCIAASDWSLQCLPLIQQCFLTLQQVVKMSLLNLASCKMDLFKFQHGKELHVVSQYLRGLDICGRCSTIFCKGNNLWLPVCFPAHQVTFERGLL